MKATFCFFGALFYVWILPAQQQSNIQHSTLSAPSNSAVSTPTVVSDTLHYFYNKEYFKNPTAPVSGLPFYKSAAATLFSITHVGSVFLNSDPNLIVYGLEGKINANIIGPMLVPMTLYLYNVNSNLLPTNIIDSINIFVGGIPNNPLGSTYGGVFGTTLNPVSHVVPGNFAVLISNKSTLSGDTVHVLRTSGVTPTNAAASSTNSTRGEGFGVLRANGIFIKTTNAPGPEFGFGTDYEFCLAPMVTYTMYAGHIAPPEVNSVPAQTVQCWQPLTFTNISTPHFTSRFFNLNVFYHHFQPFSNQPPGGFSNDSAVFWYFDDEDLDNPFLRPPLYLQNGANTVTKYYDTAGCFTSCSMRAHLRKMKAGGSSVSYRAVIMFSVCVGGNCTNVGINENENEEPLLLSENPVRDKTLSIRGPKEGYEFLLFNAMGALCLRKEQSEELTEIDLRGLATGCYFLRIKTKNGEHSYRAIKIILE